MSQSTGDAAGHLTEAALEAAARSDVVMALEDLRAVLGRLPGALGDTVWNALVVVQDWCFMAAVRWHIYVEGCRGRRP